jgi:hypothetical protein
VLTKTSIDTFICATFLEDPKRLLRAPMNSSIWVELKKIKSLTI